MHHLILFGIGIATHFALIYLTVFPRFDVIIVNCSQFGFSLFSHPLVNLQHKVFLARDLSHSLPELFSLDKKNSMVMHSAIFNFILVGLSLRKTYTW